MRYINLRLTYLLTPVVAELHWLPVAARVDFKIAVITVNLLTTEQPSYLRELL